MTRSPRRLNSADEVSSSKASNLRILADSLIEISYNTQRPSMVPRQPGVVKTSHQREAKYLR